MTSTVTSDQCLSVSIVLYHSPLRPLHSTLTRLFDAAQCAIAGAQLSRLHLTLIDNSCDSAYQSAVRSLISSVIAPDFVTTTYVASSKNAGFGAGHNTVLPALDSEFHLVLNPDAELSCESLVVGLMALQQQPDVALISPAVTGTNDEPEYLCKAYPSVLVLVLRAFAPAALQRLFRTRLEHYELRSACSTGRRADVLLASGCCMLLRSAALKAINGFNPRYFLYFEDFDLSLRVRAFGRLVFEPDMHIKHHGGYAAKKGPGHIGMFVKSGIRFFNDHGWKWI